MSNLKFMKNKTSFWEGFFATFFVGIILYWIYNAEKQNNKKIIELKSRLNSGSTLDKNNLENDWNSVFNDVNNSFRKLA
jgi:hypothetical protein